MYKKGKIGICGCRKTEKEIIECLNAALEEDSYKFLLVVLSDIARTRKAMSAAAKAAGVTRTNLYQSLSEKGNPAFETVARVANSLGYRIKLVPISKPAAGKGKGGKKRKPLTGG